MSRLPQLEYRAEFLKGWPRPNGLHMNYRSDDATLTNGDLVLPVAGGKVAKVNAAGKAHGVGIVVRGPADDKSVRVAGGIAAGDGTRVVGGGNTCIVLFSGYIVRTSAFDDTATYVVGDTVNTSASGVFGKAGSTDPVLGTILEIEDLANGKKALVIHVA